MVFALLAAAAACLFALLAWTQHRESDRRSAARVAALAAMIDGGQEPAFAGTGTPDAFILEPSPAAELLLRHEGPTHHRGWMIAAGGVPVALIVVALLVTRGPRPAAPVVLHQPTSLELLALRHDRAGSVLTVTGTVRVRGRDTAPVTAVVTGRDAAGRVVASAHAPLDDAGLDVDGESSFQVAVPDGHDVRRYQVRFETPLGPLTHVDRRHAPAGPVTP
jgi:hypothetical protein